MVGPLNNIQSNSVRNARRDNLVSTANREINTRLDDLTPVIDSAAPPIPPITLPDPPDISLPEFGVNLDVEVDLNTTWEQIKEVINFTESFNIVIINKTTKKLKRVGSYNAGSNWPLGDINGNTVEAIDFARFNGFEFFKISANYELEGENIFIQFGASGPLVTEIGLYKSTRSGNRSAEQLANLYLDNVDLAMQIVNYEARAFMAQDADSKIWVFEIAPV